MLHVLSCLHNKWREKYLPLCKEYKYGILLTVQLTLSFTLVSYWFSSMLHFHKAGYLFERCRTVALPLQQMTGKTQTKDLQDVVPWSPLCCQKLDNKTCYCFLLHVTSGGSSPNEKSLKGNYSCIYLT